MVFHEQVNGCILAVFCMFFGCILGIKKTPSLTNKVKLGVLILDVFNYSVLSFVNNGFNLLN